MIKITRFFYIHILMVPLLIVAFVTKSQMTFFIAYSVVLVHELCHLLTALILGVKVYSIVAMPFGMTVRLDSCVLRTPKKEAAIAAAGPLSNGLMLVLGIGCFGREEPSLNAYIFLFVNASMLLLNLIPVPPLDGGRLLRAAVLYRVGLMPAAKIMRRISYVCISLICLAGLFLLFYFHGNPSLIMIGAFLGYNFANEKKGSDLLIMQELLCEKEKEQQNGLIPTKLLCIRGKTPAKRILKKLNFSTFYIIAVLDSHMRIEKVITEQEVLRAIMTAGYNISAHDACLLK